MFLITIKKPDGRSMSFELIKKDKHKKFIEIRRGREPNTGYGEPLPNSNDNKIVRTTKH